MSPQDLEAFEKGMDAVFLVLDDAVEKAKKIDLESVVELAGIDMVANGKMRAMLSRLLNATRDITYQVLVDVTKRDAKILLQEMTCMAHNVDPEHMNRLARAAQDAGIKPGDWRKQ